MAEEAINDRAGDYPPARAVGSATPDVTLDLRDFGAVGDGEADDSPALQSALDALADAGGGTLFVPAGRYALITPVQKDFTGLASSITIEGVESSTPVPPPTASAIELTRGLDLVSEFAPKTGPQYATINLSGLQNLIVKDLVFIGTPNVINDALITLNLAHIGEAVVRHCEFYGLSSFVANGSIVRAIRSHLRIEQSVFLGNAANSGLHSPIIENLDWEGLVVANTIFVDYGQRAEIYSKMSYGAPLSWVNLGYAATVTPDSPRREVAFRSVFLDEGGWIGITSLPDRYGIPSAPIDLYYVTGLFMNVSNFGTFGNYFKGPRQVLIEKSHYGWSHFADSAIHLLATGDAILDEVECVASANRISAEETVDSLRIINSVFTHLDSEAQTTNVITTDDDPVQFVRNEFKAMVGREPDPAGHFYWSDQILRCGNDVACAEAQRQALADYLSDDPEPLFAITGQVLNEAGTGLSGVTVTISGSQNVATQTDSSGRYHFSGLPTSGVYTVTPTRNHYTFDPGHRDVVTPAGNQVADFVATLNRHTLSGNVLNSDNSGLPGVVVTLSGSQSATATTDQTGSYSFASLPAGGNYTITPVKSHYTFTPQSLSFPDLGGDQIRNFAGVRNLHTIRGQVVDSNNAGVAGVKVAISGPGAGIGVTDQNGNYSIPNRVGGGNYTVTPSKTHYTFLPQRLSFNNLSSDESGNFVAIVNRHTLSGRVLDGNNAGLSGVVVTLSGSQSGTATTDQDGSYSFTNLPAGRNYAVTPVKAHYTFTPPSLSINDLSGNQILDFIGALRRYTLSGRVVDNNTGVSGVVVTLSGSQSASLTTGQNGNYSFSNLLAGGSFDITPSKPGYTFSPATLSFDDLSGNEVTDFIVTEIVPVLIAQENATGAVALTSVTWRQDPFSISTSHNFSPDQRTRIILFGLNLRLEPNEDASAVTVQMEDAQHRVYNLPVEFVGQVPQFDWLSQIVVKLTDELGSGDFQVSIIHRGKSSNTASITLAPF